MPEEFYNPDWSPAVEFDQFKPPTQTLPQSLMNLGGAGAGMGGMQISPGPPALPEPKKDPAPDLNLGQIAAAANAAAKAKGIDRANPNVGPPPNVAPQGRPALPRNPQNIMDMIKNKLLPEDYDHAADTEAANMVELDRQQQNMSPGQRKTFGKSLGSKYGKSPRNPYGLRHPRAPGIGQGVARARELGLIN